MYLIRIDGPQNFMYAYVHSIPNSGPTTEECTCTFPVGMIVSDAARFC